MIVILGFIAAIAGSLLIGYSVGLGAGRRKHQAKDTRVFELEVAQSVDRSMVSAADPGNVPLMEPATDHERAIAEAVDEKFPGNPDTRQSTIRDYLDISASLDFVMSASDSQFLVDYLRWRLTHPITPSKSKGASTKS
jgi:hypothetical protein